MRHGQGRNRAGKPDGWVAVEVLFLGRLGRRAGWHLGGTVDPGELTVRRAQKALGTAAEA